MSANDDKPAKKAGFFSRWRKKSASDIENQDSKPPAEDQEVLSSGAVLDADPQESEFNDEPTADIDGPAHSSVQEPIEDSVKETIAQPAEEHTQELSPDDDFIDDELSDAAAAQPQEDNVLDDQISDTTETETGLFASWKRGLNKTGAMFGGAIGALLRQKTKIDDDLLEEIETQLLVADVGLETTTHILDELKKRVKTSKDGDLYDLLKQVLIDILATGDASLDIQPNRTNVLMLVGVNGVGKTTSIGKLANQFKHKGLSTTLAAGDTFRAAAVEQLQVWGERNDIPVVAQSTGADSASVIYDALESSRARAADVLIADTAGRLHNKSNLMEELSKVVRVMQKQDDSAPHETLLVLDACTGQNAINQAVEFKNAVPLTGLILTKMDGTAKGGVIFSLIQQVGLPVKFVGLGEGINDLAEFDPHRFVDALFSDSTDL